LEEKDIILGATETSRPSSVSAEQEPQLDELINRNLCISWRVSFLMDGCNKNLAILQPNITNQSDICQGQRLKQQAYTLHS
jgi:hypothetical protein